MMKTNKPTIITICALLFGAIIFFSCENPTGLGSRLHLNPPVVTITQPDFMSDIGETLEISGAAQDDQEVTYLYITVTGDSWKGEWVSHKGNWSGRTAVNDGTWDTQGGAGSVKWKASIPTDDMPDGEYQITVRVENNVKNSAAVSVQERRVIIDHNPPVISMMQPELTEGQYADIQPEFDKYNVRSSKDLDRLLNEQIQLQWEVTDDFSIGSVIVRLMDSEKTYYEKKLDNPGWNGKLIIEANEIQAANDSGTLVPVQNKTYLRIQTEATDKAKNTPRIQNHGWLVYWPETDKPWAEGIPGQVYGGTEVQCQAYDDDGLKMVEYQLYKKDSDVPLAGYETPQVKENLPPAEGIHPSGSFNWSFAAPKDTLEYTIKITCTDINDIRGDTIEYHFFVMDTSAPDAEFTVPLADNSLFGDANGDFYVRGNVSDGSDPRRATLVWINPKGGNPTQSRNDYLSADHDGWNNPGMDTDGNKIWELDLGDLNPVNENQERFSRTFNHKINLFNDLSIAHDGVPLKAQTFIVRSEGSGGRAITKPHTVMGDVIPPNITITTIEVRDKANELIKIYAQADWEQGLELLHKDEQIYLSGTFKDDSLDTWTSAAGGKVRIEAAWSGKAITTSPVYDYAVSPKTWKTGPFIVDEDMAKDGAGYITAKITDIGGNSNEANHFVQKDTAIPDLIRISSGNDNKAYKAGDVITIYLEFNKDVSYNLPAGGEDRTLELNSGGIALFDSENADNTSKKLYFKYTIQTGEKTNDLNVQTINFEGTWDSQADPSADSVKQNLEVSKNIVIDTTAPAIITDGIEALTTASSRGNNYFNQGQEIQLLVTFNEDIQCMNEAGIQLKLNAQDNPSNVALAKFGQSRGSNAILFTYTVGEKDNTPVDKRLNVTGIELAHGASITDKAGNALDTATFQHYDTGFIIDTTPPPALVVNLTGALVNNKVYTEEPKFTITGMEPNAAVEYNINDTPFVLYSSEVTVRGSRKHTVNVRQTDPAGNISPETTVNFTTKIDKPLVTRLSATAKTYKAQETIYIDLVLREPVSVENGSNFKLKLNVTPDQFAVYESGSDTNTLRFEYEVQNGDKINSDDYLKIIDYELTPDVKLKTTSAGSDITDELKPVGKKPSEDDTWGDNLPNYAQIKIDTLLPELVGIIDTYDDSNKTLNLKLIFNKAVNKNTGDIVLTHENTPDKPYLAPAVLTEQEYTRFGGSKLAAYYKAGTNSVNLEYKPDLTTKYILQYGFNTDGTYDTGITGPAVSVVDALKQNNAHKVTVSVNSSSVDITGDTLTIKDISLPVKGVKYIITFDKGIVKDTLGSTVDALDNTKGKLTKKIPGVNTPVIRVNKKEAVPTLNGTTVIGEQPHNASAKIDCQTPNVQLDYALGKKPTPPYPDQYSSNITIDTSSDKAPPDPLLGSFQNYANEFALLADGSAEADSFNGYIILIKAKATDKGDSTQFAESLEKAVRSVVIFETLSSQTIKFPNLPSSTGKHSYLWLRGGERETGSNESIDFPLSWAEDDPDGIKLMTRAVTTQDRYYWMSWGISSKAYFRFIAGTSINGDLTGASNGPKDWSWMIEKWSTLYFYYPLHAGASLRLNDFYTNVPNQFSSTRPYFPDYDIP